MIIGYARVSTAEQNLDLQINALKAEKCEKVIVDKLNGSVAERPGISKVVDIMRQGDTIVVWKLDRLGRSIKHLLILIDTFEKNGVLFKSIKENIDTTNASGKLVFHIFAVLSEFERNLTKERTNAGLYAARMRGLKGGRPKKLNPKKRALVVNLYKDKKHSVMEICSIAGISKPTLYKYVNENNK
jgi:DNA invertase Pin-like site-specific DNA recombinase|tara:strand:- start:6736 stop:7293 length:558 start_codon:yes stop_codon:yes gene_type:complete